MRKLSFIATLCLGVATMAPAALADSPRQFLNDALQGANSEIMLGRLAADRARDPQVREFGRTLVSDHSASRDQIIRLGRRYGVSPDRDVKPEARDERGRLADLRGREFDREFVRYMVDDHRKDIRDFREEARENHGPVSDFARDQIPTLRHHLDMAMGLNRDSGGWEGRDRRGYDDRDMSRGDRRGYDDRSNDRGYDDRDNRR